MSTSAKMQKKTPPSFTSPGTFVTFLIGAKDPTTGKATSFICHREFACYASPVLDAAFSSQFIEGQSQTYILEDTTPRAFRFFMQWVYNEKLTLWQDVDTEGSASVMASIAPYYNDLKIGDDRYVVEMVALVEAWILADKLVIPGLQNIIVQTLCTQVGDGLILSNEMPVVLQFLYENTTADSPLRRLFVHQIGIGLSMGIVQLEELDDPELVFPYQALVDVLVFQNSKFLIDHATCGLNAEDYEVEEEDF